MTDEQWLAKMARKLERHAVKTGDDRAARAVGVLRGGHAGRPAVNDDDALAYASSLLTTELATSRRGAAMRAARMYSTSKDDRQRMYHRLRRKLAQS